MIQVYGFLLSLLFSKLNTNWEGLKILRKTFSNLLRTILYNLWSKTPISRRLDFWRLSFICLKNCLFTSQKLFNGFNNLLEKTRIGSIASIYLNTPTFILSINAILITLSSAKVVSWSLNRSINKNRGRDRKRED